MCCNDQYAIWVCWQHLPITILYPATVCVFHYVFAAMRLYVSECVDSHILHHFPLLRLPASAPLLCLVAVHTIPTFLLFLPSLPPFVSSLAVFAPHHTSQGKNHPGNSDPSAPLLCSSNSSRLKYRNPPPSPPPSCSSLEGKKTLKCFCFYIICFNCCKYNFFFFLIG